MPQKHSKNSGDRHHFTYAEKAKAGVGSVTVRLGTDSQLPFGYCCLSLQPVVDGVASPSGHIYEREVIVEYLLNKMKELKAQQKKFDEQQERIMKENSEKSTAEQQELLNNFTSTQEGVGDKRKASDSDHNAYLEARKRVIHEANRKDEIEDLRRVSPWIPQFTPEAKEAAMKAPPKRPPSPITGRPLRSADLIPLNLERDPQNNESETTKYLCAVSRKSITSQRAVVIKTSNQVMLADIAEKFAYPTMTCPISGNAFKMEDVLELDRAASGFASSGKVETTKYRPSMT